MAKLLHSGNHRAISRSSIYEDICEVYTDTLSDVISEFPLHFKLNDELAYDAGGVCRETFSCFWKIAYQKHFNGEQLVVPSVCPGMEWISQK